MSIYSYPQSPVIDRIVFRENEGGAQRAYLHASAKAGTDQLTAITQGLTALGYQCLPSSKDENMALEVRGFGKPEKLLTELSTRQWISGTQHTEIDKRPPVGLFERLKKRTLQLSGLAYVVGDVNFFTYGLRQSQWQEMLAGAMYGGGTTMLLGYGRNEQSETQIKELAKKISKHIEQQGNKIDPQSALQRVSSQKPEGVFANVHAFCKMYPSEMFNLFTGLAGACVAAGAYQHKLKMPAHKAADAEALRKMRLSGWLDVGLGVMTMLSTAVGGLVEEKARDPDKPKSTGVQAALDYMHEKPLTVAGIGLMLSTMCHAVSTVIDYREGVRLGKPKHELGAIKNRAWFVGTNLLAELLIAISSKGHGAGVVSDQSVDATAISLTAEMIARQPKKKQDELITHMTEFLGRPDVLAMKDLDVQKLLQTQVEAMRRNPWALAQLSPSQVNTIPAAVENKAAMPAWQTKLALQEKSTVAAPQMSA